MATEKQAKGSVKRELKSRHLSMIALGGSIGTGLFIASGSAITTAGPGGALIGYIIIGIMVYFLMTSLAEMATYLPLTGSFAAYAGKYLSPAMGFAFGWNYWLNGALTVPVEVTTVGLIMNFWLPHVPAWVFSAITFVLIFLINYLTVKTYGETEFWLALVKVVTVVIFLIVGVLVILGIMGGQGPIGLKNFTYKQAPFVHGVPGIISVLLVAGFSFQGTEMIGIAAGETENPEKSVPAAIKSTFWRIILFYICTIFIIACILPYTNKNLLSANVSDIVTSPFTLVFKRAGLAAAASIMNAVILVAVLSSANSWMYASTRMLFSQAREGYAWRFLGYVNKRGVPIYGLLVTTLVGVLVWLTQFIGPQAYNYLIGASGLCGVIAWVGIAAAHYRFRRAFYAQGHDLSELKYHASFYPFGPIFAFLLCMLIIVCQNLDAFLQLDWKNILVTYMSVPIFLIYYLYYKFKYGSKMIPLEEVDFSHSSKGEAYHPDQSKS